MNYTVIPYLRSQVELLSEIKALTRNGSSNSRWSDAEFYRALNETLYAWADDILFPRIYEIPGGVDGSTYEYLLPRYVRPPYIVQFKERTDAYDYPISDELVRTWNDIPTAHEVYATDDGYSLHLYAPPRQTAARVVYFCPNGSVPLITPNTSLSMTNTSNQVTMIGSHLVGEQGYVKIGAEWMSYDGITDLGTTTTLHNLTRGINNTLPSSHTNNTPVAFGVAFDTPSLMGLLMDGWRANLHALFIQDGGTHETGRHEKALGLYQQKVANYATIYSPKRRGGRLRLGRGTFYRRR
jgi:hypothetical protein